VKASKGGRQVISGLEKLKGTRSAGAVPLDFETRSFRMEKPPALKVVLQENHLLGR